MNSRRRMQIANATLPWGHAMQREGTIPRFDREVCGYFTFGRAGHQCRNPNVRGRSAYPPILSVKADISAHRVSATSGQGRRAWYAAARTLIGSRIYWATKPGSGCTRVTGGGFHLPVSASDFGL